MPGVKRERAEAVGVLTLDEPATLNAMTPDLLGDLAVAVGEMTADPQVRALVLTGAGRGFCSGQNLKAAQILGDDIVAGVMKYLLADVQGVARMSGADRGRRQWCGGRRRLQPGDGRRHDRSCPFGEVHSGVQPDRAGPRSRLDLAVAAPGRPPARARTDDEQRAAFGRAGKRVGTGPRRLRRRRTDGRRAGAGAQARRRSDSRPGGDTPAARRSEHATYADQFRREIETQAEIRLSADAVEGRNAFLEKRAARFSGS